MEVKRVAVLDDYLDGKYERAVNPEALQHRKR